MNPIVVHRCLGLRSFWHSTLDPRLLTLPMHTAPQHVTAIELEQGLPEVLASPHDAGRLEAIVRPAGDERTPRSCQRRGSLPKTASTATAGSDDSYYH